MSRVRAATTAGVFSAVGGVVGAGAGYMIISDFGSARSSVVEAKAHTIWFSAAIGSLIGAVAGGAIGCPVKQIGTGVGALPSSMGGGFFP